jgi:LacI family transcriptional regulator
VASIKDIAEACGVSPMTVSRALNNSKEISKLTRERILKACEEMGYRPNAAAKCLISNKTNMIGLLIPDISNQYYSYVSKGVSAHLEELGYGLILCNTDRTPSNEMKYMDFLTQKRVDGIIIIPVQSELKNYRILIDSVPFVQVDNYVDGLEASFIGNDNYTGGRKIITHMISQGYRRIGVILSHRNSTASNDRLRGYMDVMSEFGLEIDKSIILNSNATFEDGYKLAERLIENNVDSIFAINDTMAMGVMKYCFSKGIKIPDDIGLAGYDDIEQAEMLPIPLTTVHQHKYNLGITAAKVLIDEINNAGLEKKKIILQPEIVVRKSCGE